MSEGGLGRTATADRPGEGVAIADAGAPHVSIVIPTYNNAESLRRLLRALQTSQVPAGGVEIVVVDDGSSDHTARVAAEAEVRYLHQANAGTAAARDLGWRAARGDVIVFFDDDVIPGPDVVCRLTEALTQADGVGARFVVLDGRSLVAHYAHADGLIDHRVVNGDVRWLITGAAAFRRDLLERVDGFDLDFLAAGEDVDLSLRMVATGARLTLAESATVQHDHRRRLPQLLETCYRYGTFSSILARRHEAYRRERSGSAFRMLNPLEWVRLYRRYRREASRRRSLVFLALHAIVVVPYAFGLARALRTAEPLAAPSWRQLEKRTRRALRADLRHTRRLAGDAEAPAEVEPEPAEIELPGKPQRLEPEASAA